MDILSKLVNVLTNTEIKSIKNARDQEKALLKTMEKVLLKAILNNSAAFKIYSDYSFNKIKEEE